MGVDGRARTTCSDGISISACEPENGMLTEMRWSRALLIGCSATAVSDQRPCPNPNSLEAKRGIVRFDQTDLVLYLYYDLLLTHSASSLSLPPSCLSPHYLAGVILLFVHDRHVHPYPHRRSTHRRRQTHSRNTPIRLEPRLEHGPPLLDYEDSFGRDRHP